MHVGVRTFRPTPSLPFPSLPFPLYGPATNPLSSASIQSPIRIFLWCFRDVQHPYLSTRWTTLDVHWLLTQSFSYSVYWLFTFLFVCLFFQIGGMWGGCSAAYAELGEKWRWALLTITLIHLQRPFNLSPCHPYSFSPFPFSPFPFSPFPFSPGTPPLFLLYPLILHRYRQLHAGQ